MPLTARSAILVGTGGAAGAVVRWMVLGLADSSGRFPWWTLAVNVAGCLGLGLLFGRSEGVRLGLGTGFCGGLTTFSTFTVEVAELVDAGETPVAGAYLVASVAGGIMAFAASRTLVAGGKTTGPGVGPPDRPSMGPA